MCDIIWKPREIMQSIADKELVRILRRLCPIYLTSEFIEEMLNLHRQEPSLTWMNGCLIYENKVLLNRISNGAAERTKFVYERCKQTGELADYDFAVVDNRGGNSFHLIFLHENESFTDYTRLIDLSELPLSQRERLYNSLLKLMDEGILPSLFSVYYNKKTEMFRLLIYSDVVIDEYKDAEQKQEFANGFKAFLFNERWESEKP